MMAAQSEAWQIMNINMAMTYDEIGDEFERWNSEGELVCALYPWLPRDSELRTSVERNIFDRHWREDQQTKG